MTTKKLSIRIVNFMIVRVGVAVIRCGHIGDIVNMLNLILSSLA